MTRYSGWSSWDPRVTGAGLVRCWADERREWVTERVPRVSTHHRCDPGQSGQAGTIRGTTPHSARPTISIVQEIAPGLQR
jgi:hypothetical protein